MPISLNRFAAVVFIGVALSGGPSFAQEGIDIRNIILTSRSGDCADYAGRYFAQVEDISRQKTFVSRLEILPGGDTCTISSNSIPNHDFNGPTADFANPVAEVSTTYNIPRNPAAAAAPTFLSQVSFDGILLNGSHFDLLSAGCWDPGSRRADAQGNVLAGCRPDEDEWMLDPPAYDHAFGVDLHNAHAQPDGAYHYHANPNALFLDNGTEPSPVIGFASDGFPIFGSLFRDDAGTVWAARSGYSLKTTTRPSPPAGPGGQPDGTYLADYEFTGDGDLDECNGMTVDGTYGYYVTAEYPWVLNCFVGTPDPSFRKGRP